MADEPKIVIGSDNPVANTAIIAISSITSFGHDFIVVPPPKEVVRSEHRTTLRTRTRDAAFDASKIPGAIAVSARFTETLVIIVGLVILAGVAEIVMASVWGDHPNELQKTVFGTMDWIVKGGIGVIFGLLSGKQTSKKK